MRRHLYAQLLSSRQISQGKSVVLYRMVWYGMKLYRIVSYHIVSYPLMKHKGLYKYKKTFFSFTEMIEERMADTQ